MNTFQKQQISKKALIAHLSDLFILECDQGDQADAIEVATDFVNSTLNNVGIEYWLDNLSLVWFDKLDYSFEIEAY